MSDHVINIRLPFGRHVSERDLIHYGKTGNELIGEVMSKVGVSKTKFSCEAVISKTTEGQLLTIQVKLDTAVEKSAQISDLIAMVGLQMASKWK